MEVDDNIEIFESRGCELDKWPDDEVTRNLMETKHVQCIDPKATIQGNRITEFWKSPHIMLLPCSTLAGYFQDGRDCATEIESSSLFENRSIGLSIVTTQNYIDFKNTEEPFQ